MSDFENAAHAWGSGYGPASQSLDQLDWSKSLEDVSSLRKRDRPMSFDAEGGNQSAWGEQLLADLPPQVGTWNPPKTNMDRQESVVADNANNAACLAGLQLQEGLTLAPGREYPAQVGSQTGVNGEQLLASLSIPAASQVISEDLSLHEIQKMYTQSWGFVWPLKEPKEKPKAAEEDLGVGEKWSAKTQAASIIRDLFRRPDAKRQAVAIEGGKVGFLTTTISRLASQNSLKGPQQSAPESANLPEQSSPKPANPVRLSGYTRSSSGSLRSDAQNGGLAAQAEGPPPDELPAEQSRMGPPRAASLEDGGSLEAETSALQAPTVDEDEKGEEKQREKQRETEETERGKEKDVGKRVQQAALRVAQALGGEVAAGLPVYCPEGQNGAFLGERMDLGGGLPPAGLGDLADFGWPVNAAFGAEVPEIDVRFRDASPDLLTGPDLWTPNFTDQWFADIDESNGGGGETLVTPQSADGSNEPLMGAEAAPPPPPQTLHRLWAELPPAELRSDAFRAFRTTYREEVRRLRIWTATYIGENFLPLVADLHFDACNALPALRHRHARLMLTKGLLWASFVSHILESASPADLYFMRRNSEQGPAVEPIKKLLNFSQPMRHRALTLAFLLEDLKDEAAYGPEVYRTYGALHKSAGVNRPLAFAGYGYHQISFPELTDPEPPLLDTGATSVSDEVEVIEFEDEPLFNKCIFQKNPFAFRWGTFWFNEKRLEATGKGLARAGARGRQMVQALTEQTLSSHVRRFDCMASGGTPSLEKYLAFARYTTGATTALGLAFCAIGQELADAGQWSPTESGLEGLFDATGGALALAGGVFRIMSEVRTYEADLVQCRLNALAIRMREALCSYQEAVDFLVAKVAGDIESLEAEIVSRAPKDRFPSTCWRLAFDLCRTCIARFRMMEQGRRISELFDDA